MPIIQQNKIVLFGAGKIGRSFIGQLFSRSGYEVVFVDVYKQLIDELNIRRCYKVIIKSDNEEILIISNARGVYAGDHESVAMEVATAGIVSVSVGQNGLPGIFPLLAKGLTNRLINQPDAPLDIIIAENMRNADLYFRDELKRLLPDGYPFNERVGLVETSIGKMVPIMLKKDVDEDILQVFAEPFNTLILDKKAFKNPIPAIEGLSPKDNMKAWVDRKLFIHNLGHAAAAYIGYHFNPGFIYIHEALDLPHILTLVRKAMLQSSEILQQLYPGEFTEAGLTNHIDDLLKRFRSKALGDTIYRVGCDLPRKLGPDDRLAGAIKAALAHGLPHDRILFPLVCGFNFRAQDEQGNRLPQDIEFAALYEQGFQPVLTKICGFDPSQNVDLFNKAQLIEERLKNTNPDKGN